MLINHTFGFIFVHIPKCGGTAIQRMLEDGFPGTEVEPRLHKHATALDAQRVLGANVLSDYYTFAVVRHPIRRLRSLYWFVLERAQDRQRRRALGLPVKASASAPWDAALVDNMTALGEVGWITGCDHAVQDYGRDVKRICQSAWCEHEGTQLVDDVYKLEEVGSLVRSLEQRYGRTLTLPRVNLSSNSARESQTDWPPALVAFGWQHHRRVFERYGYDVPLADLVDGAPLPA